MISTRLLILLLLELGALFLKIVHDPLLKQLLFSLNPGLLSLLFKRFLINLLLKLKLHLFALLLFLLLHDVFFVSSTKNIALLLKCNI